MKRASEERAALLRDQVLSGQSVSQFCRERGLDPKRMYLWRKRAANEATKPGTPAGKFQRVQSGTEVRIELSAGMRLIVPLESLNSVLSELERR